MTTRESKCLITGGAGFIGSHLCDSLISQGFEVFCIDNLLTGNKRNINHILPVDNFHFYQHDIIQPLPASLQKALKGVSYIYHLASPASPLYYQKYAIDTLLVNSIGTYHMLEIARQNNSLFLLTSTSEVYGNPLVHPQVETYFGNVNPNGIRSCYDEGKRFAESMTMEYLRKFDVDIRIIRIFNTYGPRMQPDDGRVISNFTTQALSGCPITIYGDGSQTRSFCYVSDMVRGIIAAMVKGKTKGEVFNLGLPREQSIKEIADIIVKLTKTNSKIVYKQKPSDDPQKRKPDISKAKKILDWEPRVSLEEGIQKTADYFRYL